MERQSLALIAVSIFLVGHEVWAQTTPPPVILPSRPPPVDAIATVTIGNGVPFSAISRQKIFERISVMPNTTMNIAVQYPVAKIGHASLPICSMVECSSASAAFRRCAATNGIYIAPDSIGFFRSPGRGNGVDQSISVTEGFSEGAKAQTSSNLRIQRTAVFTRTA